MSRFVQGADGRQQTLLPECLDDYVAEDNPVRVVDVFVDEPDLRGLGFEGMTPAATGRPAYHPAMLLKLYVYGCLNKVQSRRRLEREAQRNVDLMWLTGRLAPDHKTIADFRRENGAVTFGTFFAHEASVIGSGDFTATESPLRISVSALERIAATSRELGISDEVPELVQGWLKDAVSRGYIDEELAALIKVLRSRGGSAAIAA